MNKNDKAEFEALQQSMMVYAKVYFETKDKYFSLMKAFIDKNINGTRFIIDRETCESFEKDFDE